LAQATLLEIEHHSTDSASSCKSALRNMKSCAIALLVVGAGAMQLTPENWDAETAGKTVLIKFQAPW